MLFKNSVRASKRTPQFTITAVKYLILFMNITTIYLENIKKTINTKCIVTDR
jgi:hypothetical protein